MSFEIQMFRSVEEVRDFEVVDRFRLRPDKGWMWLQRLCFAVLRWVGARDTAREVSVKRISFPSEKNLVRALHERRAEVVKMMHGRGAKRLIIGAQDWVELVASEEMNQYLCFNYDRPDRLEVFGMIVEIVPWMRGMVVLPNEQDGMVG